MVSLSHEIDGLVAGVVEGEIGEDVDKSIVVPLETVFVMDISELLDFPGVVLVGRSGVSDKAD